MIFAVALEIVVAAWHWPVAGTLVAQAAAAVRANPDTVLPEKFKR